MRQERHHRITDTKRILDELTTPNEEGECYSNLGIAWMLNIDVRTVQRWWNGTCPTAQHYYRLCRLLEENTKRKKEEEYLPMESREERQKRWSRFSKHTREIDHMTGENGKFEYCSECHLHGAPKNSQNYNSQTL